MGSDQVKVSEAFGCEHGVGVCGVCAGVEQGTRLWMSAQACIFEGMGMGRHARACAGTDRQCRKHQARARGVGEWTKAQAVARACAAMDEGVRVHET